QDMWKQQGSKDSVSLAREQVTKILDAHRVEPLPDDRGTQLESTFRSILRRYGIPESSLPSGI
ncbi:MAG: hypothetical protein ACXADO_11885, partial [Candidatus Thorarchaeota archaeon]